jgi:hypothetical protein
MQHTTKLLLLPTLDFACAIREFEFQGHDLFRVFLSEGDTIKFRNYVDAQKGIDYDQVWPGCTAIGQEGDA